MFICGRRSFRRKRQNDSHVSAKTSKRRQNPYADRGLDKFSALLADLEAKKQKIYDEMGCEDISVIQFVYSSDSEDLKAIVVKNKNPNYNFPPKTAVSLAASDNSSDGITEKGEMVCYCVPATMVLLVLLLLAVYGRSFSIICTSVVWYVLPGNSSGRISLRRTKAKKKPW